MPGVGIIIILDLVGLTILLSYVTVQQGTVAITTIQKQCDSKDIIVDYTVSNTNGTAVLPAHTPGDTKNTLRFYCACYQPQPYW